MTPHEDVTKAWDHVVEQWDDIARHDALFKLVAQHANYAWAAGRYKDRAGDVIADKQIDRLRKAATATLLATASRSDAPEPTPYKRLMVIFVVMLVMLILGLFAAKMLHDRRAAITPGVTNPPRP